MTKTTYNLSKLIAQTADIEILNPIDGTKTGVILTMLPTDSPKIATLVAEAMGGLPKYPENGTIGDMHAFAQAQNTATRKLIAARIVGSNHEGLSTPAQIAEFCNEVDIKVLDQIEGDSAERSIYFR